MILGRHTVAETKDLIAIYDYKFGQMAKAMDSTANKPQDIVDDWNSLKGKWAVERKASVQDLLTLALGNPLVSNAYIPSENIWKRVYDYIDGSNAFTKGSFLELQDRFSKLTGHGIDYSAQPTIKSDDPDDALFGKLSSATRGMDAAADAAKKKAGEVASSNTTLLVGGAVIGTLAVIAAIRYT